MSKSIGIGTPTPDFILDNFEGDEIKLSKFFGQKNVLLVLNRGFI